MHLGAAILSRRAASEGRTAFAARQFASIEINGTFYSLQRPQSFVAWRDATPDVFIFAMKGPRFITHIKKLKDVETPLADASGVLAPNQKLGPVLWQLPPNFHFHPDKLAKFFDLLPRTMDEAVQLAGKHDARLNGRNRPKAGSDRPLRHAIAIRHDSFRDPAFIALLRRHRIGLVVADTVEWPLFMDATADFVYVRLHGSKYLYASCPNALAAWAARIHAWQPGAEAQGDPAGPAARKQRLDVYVHFDNDAKVRAPVDAKSLVNMLDR